MFDETFINSLPDNPILAGRIILETFTKFNDDVNYNGTQKDQYIEYLKAFSLLCALCETLEFKQEPPKISEDIYSNISKIVSFFKTCQPTFDHAYTEFSFEYYKGLLDKKFGKRFFYEFTEGDLNKIQKLIDELRQLIIESAILSDNHKNRLLDRLEKLQSELHKKMSNLDKFWGFFAEAGVVLGKFGNDAKPIVDVIYKILMIIWRTQAIAEQLPTDSLPPPQIPLDQNSQK